MSFFEISFTTAFLYSLILVVSLFLVNLVPFLGEIVDVLILPLVLVGLGLWGLVILSGFLSSAMFYVILALVTLVYFEFKKESVSKFVHKKLRI